MKKLVMILSIATLTMSSCSVCYECTSDEFLGLQRTETTCDREQMQDYEADGWDCEVE